MRRKLILFYFCILWGSWAQSQVPDTMNTSIDTIPVMDSTLIFSALDTTGIQQDSSVQFILDSLGNPIRKQAPKFNKSPDALSDEIDYGSKGRKKIDLANKIVHLWDEAYVNYQDIQVKGDYITFDFESNLATAVATYDTSGRLKSKATFVQGETTFQYDYLKYNFKTEKGIVKQAVTKEGELFVHGALTKFVSSPDSSGNDVIYNQDAIVTSCNLDHPHFGIRTNKLKVVPEKLAVIGPSRLEIADVPTPLWLPFGFFPIAGGKSSGLILPKSYDLSPVWGFGMTNIGYYFPINDYLDAKITGDVYLRGSWGINAALNYNKKYKYNGQFLLTRSSRRNEVLETGEFERDISYRFYWKHNQDRKAHPFRSFSTSVDIQTAGFNRLNRTDARSTNRDNLSSSINYSYQFGSSPWSLTAGANFVQSLSQRTVNLTLPEGRINMRQIYPLKRKVKVGKERWYEKIGLQYSSQFKNYLQATDTTFYTAEAWRDARYGVEHRATSNANFKFLKYFSFNPSASYQEVWFFKEVERSLSNKLVLDTVGQFTNPDGTFTQLVDTTYGVIQEDIGAAFLPFRTGNISAGVSTKLFWTETKQTGFLRGFRHTTTPSIALAYNPDTQTPYERTFDTDFREGVTDLETYSIIPSGVFSARPRQANLGLNFSAENVVELKYYSKKDSIDKKYQLTNFRVSTNYNFIADSFRLADPMISGRSTFFKKRSSINYAMTLNPYKIENGRERDQFFWEDEFSLPSLSVFTVRTTTRLSFQEIRAWIKGEEIKKSNSTRKSPVLLSLPELFDNFRFEYKLDYTYRNINGLITRGISSNAINISGNIQLTDKWMLNLGNFGYDFSREGYTYPDLGFSRDLHCWRMTFSWQPRGAFGLTNGGGSTFNFFIGVNSGTLDFLKYNYNRGNFDF